jgi:acylaminoacyl-peptidase
MRGLFVTLGEILGCVSVAWLAFGSEESHLLEASDLFELEYVSDPRISPDGEAVVFVRDRPDVLTDEWYSDLWIVGTGGGPPRPLTSGPHHDVSPRFSPDGERLAFLSDRGGSFQIYVLHLGAGTVLRLTDLDETPSGLAWSPDGRWLSFAAFVPRPLPEFAALPRPPDGASWAAAPEVYDRLVYRVDGLGYLNRKVLRLFVVPSLGGTPRRVTRNDDLDHEVGLDTVNAERRTAAAWTPDGKYLVTSAVRREVGELRPLESEIFELSLADGTPRALTSRRGPDAAPAVSSDGRRIAYVGFDDRRTDYQVARLYVMDRDGGHPRVLTGGLDREVLAADWTGDGESLLFHYHDHGDTKIARVDLEGAVTELSGNLSDGYSTYGGGSFTVSGAGAYAYTHSRSSAPVQVAVASVDEPAARVLTSFNDGLLAAKSLAEAEELWVTASDGRRIQGWVLKPPGFDPRRRHPLILEIHGGPFRDYGDRFDPEKQVFAAQGYLVLYVNQRGSAGYGEEFAQSIHHAYPSTEVLDLDAAVTELVDRGWADPSNLFVAGGSGGAMLACWLTAESSRYRAAVAAYPLVNWTSFTLTTDLSALVAYHWFPGPPWDHPELYRSRSPLFRVGEVETPTLLIAGEEDHRTPAAEAEQYFAALKHRGVDTALVRFPGESHYSERHPSHQIARLLLTLGWFDRYRSGVDAAPETAGAVR